MTLAPRSCHGLVTLALAVLTPAVLAHDPSLNEIYVAHVGVDDQEFVELEWDAFGTLNNRMLLVVEGDSSSSGLGELDFAVDLTGEQIPTNGFYVIGTAGGPDVDLVVGPDNVFENGTETFYLVVATDPAAVLALVGTDVDADDDLVTDIATMPGVTIVDIVAITDGDAGDEVYDGAQVLGPDGGSVPAGVFRGNDAPNAWCTDTFLDENLGSDRTPGEPNIACPGAEPGSLFCDGSDGGCPCGAVGAAGHGCPNTNLNGNGAQLVGTGSASFSNDTLSFSITSGAPSKAGILITGATALNYPDGNPGVPNSTGIFCIAPQRRGGVFFTDPNGEASVLDFQGQAFGATAEPFGSTTYYQYWYRDPGNACQNPPASAAAFNFSNGYEIDWQL